MTPAEIRARIAASKRGTLQHRLWCGVLAHVLGGGSAALDAPGQVVTRWPHAPVQS